MLVGLSLLFIKTNLNVIDVNTKLFWKRTTQTGHIHHALPVQYVPRN
jgi:hypothetical protein